MTKSISEVAISYIGQTEKPKNSGFTMASFQEKMVHVGWSKAMPWCAYFCKLVAIEAMPEHKEEFMKLFSGMAIVTFNNFKATGKTFQTPQVNDLIVWQHGKTSQGHIGVVTSVDKKGVITIEGNTNDLGGREGYIVAQKDRKINLPFNPKGLNLLGFIRL
jgi:hypothetical protein